MQKSKEKFILISNWKANPSRSSEALKIFESIKKIKINSKKILPIICTPNVFFSIIPKKYKGNTFLFGSQNISHNENTEQTGEILAESLSDFNIKYTIIGHSERRQLGETNLVISEKIKNALKNKITPIVCVGELTRDVHGNFLLELEKQIKETFSGIESNQISKIIIAYEPVWAIGTGATSINNHDLNQTILYIKKVLAEIYDRKVGLSAKIIYGGSVDDENAKDLMNNSDIEGFLIGRASVNPSVYAKIIKQITQ